MKIISHRPPSASLTSLASVRKSAWFVSVIFLSGLLFCACSGPRPLHGGRALTTATPSGTLTQSLAQSDNPAQVTRQTQDTIHTRTYALPWPPPDDALATQHAPRTTPSAPRNTPYSPPSTPSLQYSNTPFLLAERSETHATTELGAAQRDTGRELAAKLGSLRGMVWVGVGLFVFGLASLFWPPLRAIIGSVTTSVVMALGGVALMILPTLVVGNELLILGGVGATVGAWFLAHRHGHLRGLASGRR
jgi:hypothetical protein